MIRICTALLLLGLVSGCALVQPAPPTPPPVGSIIDSRSQAVLTGDQLKARLQQAQVVVVGEHHTHPGHHQVQLDVLKAMSKGPDQVVVVVEWLDHTAQAHCDRLSAGDISVEEFARLVDWKNKWGYGLKLYAPILEFVRANKLPLVAANAPLKVVRSVARQGLDSLTPQQRAQLAPALDLDEGPYRTRLLAMAKAHGVGEQAAQHDFAVAQIARDETMAHHLAERMIPWPQSKRRAVLFAGGGHLAHGLGLMPRIARRLPGVRILTVLPVSSDSRRLRSMAGGHPAPADLVIITQPGPRRPPRLGIVFKPVTGGIEIRRVFTDTPAHKAGIKAGDILVGIDGKPLSSPMDIHRTIKQAPYAPHVYRIMRQSKPLEFTITLDKPEAPAK